MLRSEKGYILPLVMMLIMMITALITHQMGLLAYEDKVLKEMTWHKQSVVAAKEIMLSLIAGFADDCQIAQQSSLALIGKDQSWWLQHGCRLPLDKDQAFYVTEQMMLDNCAIMENNQPVAAQYSRITLMYQGLMRVIIQANVARISAREQACPGTTHIVKPGVQWQLEL